MNNYNENVGQRNYMKVKEEDGASVSETVDLANMAISVVGETTHVIMLKTKMLLYLAHMMREMILISL